jgi:hypothetical protein
VTDYSDGLKLVDLIIGDRMVRFAESGSSELRVRTREKSECPMSKWTFESWRDGRNVSGGCVFSCCCRRVNSDASPRSVKGPPAQGASDWLVTPHD